MMKLIAEVKQTLTNLLYSKLIIEIEQNLHLTIDICSANLLSINLLISINKIRVLCECN